MSRYVISQDQLNDLQHQIKQHSRLSEAKEERIKDLERHKILVSNSKAVDLINTIGHLEDQIRDLKILNKQLYNIKNDNAQKIEQMESLLNEERKLREFSENFAKQVEAQCAEESLIRELTTELCRLQKEMIEIEGKRILDLQKKNKKLSKQLETSQTKNEKENIEYSRASVKENIERDVHLKLLTRRLQGQLVDLYDQSNNNSSGFVENEENKKKLESWLREIGDVMENLNNVQEIRKDLSYLKREIEDRKKSSTLRFN